MSQATRVKSLRNINAILADTSMILKKAIRTVALLRERLLKICQMTGAAQSAA